MFEKPIKMSTQTFITELSNLVKARFPLIYIVTWEEKRAIESIHAMASDKNYLSSPRKVWTWSVTEGFLCDGASMQSDIRTSMRALEFIDNHKADGIFILKDLYYDLSRPAHTIDQAIIRKLKDLVNSIKNDNFFKTVIITGYEKFIPDDLQKEILIKHFELPDRDEIKDVLMTLVEQNRHNSKLTFDLSEETINKLCETASGLTLHEAENAFALSIVTDGQLNGDDIQNIANEKKQIIQRNGLLEFSMPKLKMEDIGGLENLKKWIFKRSDSWSDRARDFNIPTPKGVLLTGLPGCGKSLMAQTISSLWNVPLLKLDMGALYEGLVGSSERNMRNVIQTAEAMAPCVLWVDEIEKAFSGIGSSGDSGVSTRLFGTFLTWMQEKKKFVFVAATANNIDNLPPELMRKGRFDEIFFVDLPTWAEREIILKIHMKKRLNKPEILGDLTIGNELTKRLVDNTEGFTGAELEHIVVSALFEAFSNRRPVTEDDFMFAIEGTVPLNVTQAEQIRRIREWANLRAVSATSVEHKSSQETPSDIVSELPKPASTPRGGRSIEF